MVPLVFFLPSYAQGLLFVLVTNSNPQTHSQCWATLVPICDGQNWKWPKVPTLVHTPVGSSLRGRRVHEYTENIPLIRSLIQWLWDNQRETVLEELTESGASEALSGSPREPRSRGRRGASCEQPLAGSQRGVGRRDVACRQDQGELMKAPCLCTAACRGQSWKKRERYCTSTSS